VVLEAIVFWLAAAGAIGGALGVVLLRNPFYSVLALVAHLVALAVLFLLAGAEFIAAAQVVVYAGAVMVLYIFVVAYIGGSDEPLAPAPGGAVARLGPLFAAAVGVELLIAVLGSALIALDSRGPGVPSDFGTPGAIGQLLLERFLIAFEAASFLLLVAAVGAVVLARRRRGLPEAMEPETVLGAAAVGGEPEHEAPAPAGAPGSPGTGTLTGEGGAA
jgi:NADH-quinone oxidoreductase subunit J